MGGGASRKVSIYYGLNLHNCIILRSFLRYECVFSPNVRPPYMRGRGIVCESVDDGSRGHAHPRDGSKATSAYVTQ